MTWPVRERAYAKVNLCLFLGPPRPDGRHELVTLFDSVSLADTLTVAPVEAEADEVVCDGVPGPNLVADALSALRAAGWEGPRLRVQIDKRIPVAAGMGGGSADAAAMLRLAPHLAPIAAPVLARVAAGLGADVPSQLRPGPSLGTGAGEVLEAVPAPPAYGVLVLPAPFPLSTADVYQEADRLGLARPPADLAALRARVVGVLPDRLPDALAVNDLQSAALALAPAIGDALAAARRAGADHSLVCGSGPTVIGLFWGGDGPDRASAAARNLPGALAARPVRGGVDATVPNQ